jgi:quercetin dioxygenase-like cupin family protein
VTRFRPRQRQPDPPPGCRGVAVVAPACAPGGEMGEPSAPHPILCVVLEGCGRMRVGGEERPVAAGECHRWPPDVPHKLWAEDSVLRTLMIECGS